MAVTSALHGHKIARFPSSATCRKRLSEEELDRESQPSASNKKFRREEYSFGNNNAASNGAEWVDLMIQELMGASSVDDAKSRAATLFDNLKEFIAEAKERELESMTRENLVLKREVAMRHRNYKQCEEQMDQEVKNLKDKVGKYEDQVKSLEQNNNLLTIHLGLATGLAF